MLLLRSGTVPVERTLPSACLYPMKSSGRVLTCEHLAFPHGQRVANSRRDCRLVLQRLGRNSLPAGSDAKKDSSARISSPILRCCRNQYFVLRTYTAGARAFVVPKGCGRQSEFRFHRQTASVVHTFSAGGHGADFGGQYSTERQG